MYVKHKKKIIKIMLVLRKNKDWNTTPTMESFLSEFFGENNLSLGHRFNENKVNFKEDDNSYGIELALPGFKKEDINIELNDSVISISSEVEKSDDNSTFKSSFEKSYFLPDDVDIDNIEASMENGVLSITINKIKEVETTTKIKKIDIK